MSGESATHLPSIMVSPLRRQGEPSSAVRGLVHGKSMKRNWSSLSALNLAEKLSIEKSVPGCSTSSASFSMLERLQEGFMATQLYQRHGSLLLGD